jgi:hypothetical protein
MRLMNHGVSTYLPSLSEEIIRCYLVRLEAGGHPSGSDDVRAIPIAARCGDLLATAGSTSATSQRDRLWCNRFGCNISAKIRKRRFGPVYGKLWYSEAPPIMSKVLARVVTEKRDEAMCAGSQTETRCSTGEWRPHAAFSLPARAGPFIDEAPLLRNAAKRKHERAHD